MAPRDSSCGILSRPRIDAPNGSRSGDRSCGTSPTAGNAVLPGRFPRRVLGAAEQHRRVKRRNHLESPLELPGPPRYARSGKHRDRDDGSRPDLASGTKLPSPRRLATWRGYAARCSCFPACCCRGRIAGMGDRRPAPASHRLRRLDLSGPEDRCWLLPIMQCTICSSSRCGAIGGLAVRSASRSGHPRSCAGLSWISAPLPGLPAIAHSTRFGSEIRRGHFWNGTAPNRLCSRGHGLLQISEMSSGYSAKPQWLKLDRSWSGLFARGFGGEHDARTARRLETVQRHPGRG